MVGAYLENRHKPTAQERSEVMDICERGSTYLSVIEEEYSSIQGNKWKRRCVMA